MTDVFKEFDERAKEEAQCNLWSAKHVAENEHWIYDMFVDRIIYHMHKLKNKGAEEDWL